LDDKELALGGLPPGLSLPAEPREREGNVHDRQTESPEVFDRAHAMEATGGDEDLLREIVGIFVEDSPRMIEELGAAIRTGNQDAARRAAHTLKGSVAVLGAKALAAVARDAESHARAGDLEAAAAAFARVEEEAARLAPVLEELLAG
jgi:HPt (histidine-containing phosphotransfer) domain-containing protein